jgi:hypothetical protein
MVTAAVRVVFAGFGATTREAPIGPVPGSRRNFIDTANAYNDGHSEETIGAYLDKHPGAAGPAGDRDQVRGWNVPR